MNFHKRFDKKNEKNHENYFRLKKNFTKLDMLNGKTIWRGMI